MTTHRLAVSANADMALGGLPVLGAAGLRAAIGSVAGVSAWCAASDEA
jgi:hypothetical protein